MSWIRIIDKDQAEGTLAELYRQVAPNDEIVDNVLGLHSLNPQSLADHLALYKTIMYRPGPLSRREREIVAVAVSAANQCHY